MLVLVLVSASLVLVSVSACLGSWSRSRPVWGLGLSLPGLDNISAAIHEHKSCNQDVHARKLGVITACQIPGTVQLIGALPQTSITVPLSPSMPTNALLLGLRLATSIPRPPEFIQSTTENLECGPSYCTSWTLVRQAIIVMLLQRPHYLNPVLRLPIPPGTLIKTSRLPVVQIQTVIHKCC